MPRVADFFASVFKFLLAVFLFAVLVGVGRVRLLLTTCTSRWWTTAWPPARCSPRWRRSTQPPREVRVGQRLTISTIAADLHSAGYNVNPQMGTYDLRENAILIKPPARNPTWRRMVPPSRPNGGEVSAITAENGVALQGYKLEPQLITALSEDKNRTKRRLVTFDEIPPRMVEAVTAIEDRRFFEHGGVNYLRTAKCALAGFYVARKGVRRLDHHPAARARLLSHAREKILAQTARNHDHVPA